MNRKAFTLTELLVVVVIIGTLAAVVLPKFTKILETRKTTEAEQLMAAVRNEQEARCKLDKSYTIDKDKLASWPKDLGNNYKYELMASGISATSDKGYKLAIQSYRDGSICCSGDYCSKLNKSYPQCSDTVVSTDCDASDLPTSPEPKNSGECPSEQPATTKVTEGDCVITTAYHLEPYPSCWQATVTKDCSDCPVKEEDCPDGFVNGYCTCIKCDISKNMRPNATKDACECIIDEKSCEEKGEVYWDNALTTSGFTRGEPECGCKPCNEVLNSSKYPQCNCKLTYEDCLAQDGKALFSSFLNPMDCSCEPCEFFGDKYFGKSSTGKMTDCEQRTCGLTREDCGSQGKVLVIPTKEYECSCESCEYFGEEYSGSSSTGYISGCEHREKKCEITREECGAQGKVLLTPIEDPSACSCEPCSFFSNESFGNIYSGTSSTGYVNDCDYTEKKCPLEPADCAKEGKVLRTSYYNPEDCSCEPCDYFGEEYSGTSSTGNLSGCTRKECELTEALCAAEGKVLQVPSVQSYNCSCKTCEELGMVTKESGTDGTIRSCEGRCKHKLQECIEKGEVFEWAKGTNDCACKPCNSYPGYDGTTSTGKKEDCSNCPK